MVRADATPHTITFLLLPRVHLLDLAGPMQTFYEAAELGAPYRLRQVGTTASVTSGQGLRLAGLEPLPEVGPNELVVVPGTESEHLNELPATVPADWLRAAQAAGATVCSICTGAFALGAAGLLDGRECTTHWRLAPRLAADFPAARVREDRLFVKGRSVATSAGVASGIDLALSLVEDHCGPRLVARVAREMVVYLRRDGSQEQQSAFLRFRTHLHPGVHRVQDWLVGRPEANPSLAELAEVARMSPRHLTRTFREATGITLKEFSHRIKLEVAANLLRNPGLTVQNVAARCGFDHPRQLRRLWRRHFRTSPTAWRESELSA